MSLISKIICKTSSPYFIFSGKVYTCSTASGTVNKAITGLSTSDLSDGLTIKVKFTYSNIATNPKIYVDSSTYTLYRYGTTLVGTDETSSWHDGEIVDISFVASGNTYICYLNRSITYINSSNANLSQDPLKYTKRGKFYSSVWSRIYFSTSTAFTGQYFWTDGKNVYYSNSSSQYAVNKISCYGDLSNTSNNLFSVKKWYGGLTNFSGYYIWTDGDNIYYSSGSEQYSLNHKSWSTKTWSGLTNFSGSCIWTDGDNIYYSLGTTQYVLNKSTSTWTTKTWSGLTNFAGTHVWTDGDNIYYSSGSAQYVLNKSTSTWTTKTWSGLTSVFGSYIWTDGDNIYYSSGTIHYVLNKSTSTWITKTWSGLTNFYGYNVWTDGDNIYHSSGSATYLLNKECPENTLPCSTETSIYWHKLVIYTYTRDSEDETIGYTYVNVEIPLPSKRKITSISELGKLLYENGYISRNTGIECDSSGQGEGGYTSIIGLYSNNGTLMMYFNSSTSTAPFANIGYDWCEIYDDVRK